MPEDSLEKLPNILVLDPIRTSQLPHGKLGYPKLERYLREYEPCEAVLWREFTDAPVDSMRALDAGRRLAQLFFLETASQTIQSNRDNQPLWVNRFNVAGDELYDTEIDYGLWCSLFNESLLNLARDKVIPDHEKQKLLTEYEKLGFNFSELSQDPAKGLPEVRPEWNKYVLLRFQRAIGSINNEVYAPRQIEKLFTATLKLLPNTNTKWKIVADADSNRVMVVPEDNTIIIGQKRTDATKVQARGLVAHELMTHYSRAQKGSEYDQLLKNGLPGYLDAEEGLAMINQYATGDDARGKLTQRYIDTGIARGLLGVSPSRKTMISIVTMRKMLHRKNLSKTKAAQQAISWVDRMYRGGPGNIPNGTTQPIFTKDLSYLTGYIKMAGYINKKLDDGHNPKDIFDYLYLGKFDPTNDAHVAYVKEVTGKSLG